MTEATQEEQKPWTPDQPVRHDATDTQLQERAGWWVTSSGNRHPDVRVLLAREFAAAQAKRAADVASQEAKRWRRFRELAFLCVDEDGYISMGTTGDYPDDSPWLTDEERKTFNAEIPKRETMPDLADRFIDALIPDDDA